jgi:hypothetical protein
MKRIIKIPKAIIKSKPIQNNLKITTYQPLKLDTKPKIYHPDINIYEELKTIEYILKN